MKNQKVLWIAAALAAMCLTACGDDGSETVVKSYSDYEINGIVLENGVYTDRRDQEKYKVLKYGGRYWMVENLRYDGQGSKDSSLFASDSWCHSEGDCDLYGRLYTYDAALEACPDGWHVPYAAEWNYLSKDFEKYSQLENMGTLLKSTDHWANEEGVASGSNRIGFNALPAGRHNIEGGEMPLGKYAYFWSRENLNMELAYGFALLASSDYFTEGEYYRKHGMSVRCISDYYAKVTENGPLDSSYLQTISHQYGTLEYEGETYRTVVFNGKEVMAENLNADIGKNWCYNNDPENCKKYGRLYDKETAAGVCPEGWGMLNFADLPDGLFSEYLDLESWQSGKVSHDEWGLSLQAAGGYDVSSNAFYDMGYTAYFWATGAITAFRSSCATCSNPKFEPFTAIDKALYVRCARALE